MPIAESLKGFRMVTFEHYNDIYVCKDNVYEGDIVLVIRHHVMLPYRLAKDIGKLRYLKNYTVRCMWIAGRPSSCIVIKREILESLMYDKDLTNYIGKDVSQELKLNYLASFLLKNEHKNKNKSVSWDSRNFFSRLKRIVKNFLVK